MFGSIKKKAAAKKSAAASTASIKAARDILLDLLAIPGVSGHEKAVAERIIHTLRAAGCPAGACW